MKMYAYYELNEEVDNDISTHVHAKFLTFFWQIADISAAKTFNKYLKLDNIAI